MKQNQLKSGIAFIFLSIFEIFKKHFKYFQNRPIQIQQNIFLTKFSKSKTKSPYLFVEDLDDFGDFNLDDEPDCIVVGLGNGIEFSIIFDLSDSAREVFYFIREKSFEIGLFDFVLFC